MIEGKVRHLGRGSEGGKCQGGGLGRIIVHNQVDGRDLMGPGQTVKRKVLRPNTRVKKLRLMTGQDERSPVEIRYWLSGLPEITARRIHCRSSRGTTELNPGSAQDG